VLDGLNERDLQRQEGDLPEGTSNSSWRSKEDKENEGLQDQSTRGRGSVQMPPEAAEDEESGDQDEDDSSDEGGDDEGDDDEGGEGGEDPGDQDDEDSDWSFGQFLGGGGRYPKLNGPKKGPEAEELIQGIAAGPLM
jgi:hypothetical protein